MKRHYLADWHFNPETVFGPKLVILGDASRRLSTITVRGVDPRRPYSIAGEIRVLRSHFSDRSRSRDQNSLIAGVRVFLHFRSRLKCLFICSVSQFWSQLFYASKPLKKLSLLLVQLGPNQFRSHIGSQNHNRDRWPIRSQKTEIRMAARSLLRCGHSCHSMAHSVYLSKPKKQLPGQKHHRRDKIYAFFSARQWGNDSTVWGDSPAKLHRKPGEKGNEATGENSKNPVETAPRSCRFPSMVVVKCVWAFKGVKCARFPGQNAYVPNVACLTRLPAPPPPQPDKREIDGDASQGNPCYHHFGDSTANSPLTDHHFLGNGSNSQARVRQLLIKNRQSPKGPCRTKNTMA